MTAANGGFIVLIHFALVMVDVSNNYFEKKNHHNDDVVSKVLGISNNKKNSFIVVKTDFVCYAILRLNNRTMIKN